MIRALHFSFRAYRFFSSGVLTIPLNLCIFNLKWSADFRHASIMSSSYFFIIPHLRRRFGNGLGKNIALPAGVKVTRKALPIPRDALTRPLAFNSPNA
ncbi:hypothetical protein CJ20_260 [Escherichia phage CJ20]|nr:hypothetical protein CJ20_260 [Escherichia phage CJ20]